MAGDVKPIETRYRGYRMRSRLEARWAVFFDAMKLEWQYEREGFRLPSGLYLPDFWLPQVKMWAEVKPTTLTATEVALCKELVAQTRFPCLRLIGPPENKPYWAYEWWGDEGIGECDFCLTNYHGYVTDEGRFYGSTGGDHDSKYDDTEEAVKAARSARFEFGQEGPG